MGAFIETVWREGSEHARVLPWRFVDDPYAVLVSEVMLQQTQVRRVLDRWQEWLECFPTLEVLAAAPQAEVLAAWQGMGYNRRALALKKTAEICVERHGGCLPEDKEELLALPGVGPATAAGVLAFAFEQPAVYLETNVRAVFLHHFFPDVSGVSDRDLVPLVESTCPGWGSVPVSAGRGPREWYYALLDAGAHLKSVVPNPSRRSGSYHRQSPFEGSRRQKRAALLRMVLACPGVTVDGLWEQLVEAEVEAGRPGLERGTVDSILSDLSREGFIEVCDGECFPV